MVVNPLLKFENDYACVFAFQKRTEYVSIRRSLCYQTGTRGQMTTHQPAARSTPHTALESNTLVNRIRQNHPVLNKNAIVLKNTMHSLTTSYE